MLDFSLNSKSSAGCTLMFGCCLICILLSMVFNNATFLSYLISPKEFCFDKKNFITIFFITFFGSKGTKEISS